MILTDFSDFICAKLNQIDATSVELCKEFVNRRYEMIFRQRNWRDKIANISTSVTDTVTGVLQLPGTIDRILAIRASGDHILHPVDSPMVMQLDPTIFERSGTPVAYEEFSQDASVSEEAVNPPTPVVVSRYIRFLPIPDVATSLLITGLRPFAELSDNGEPILRGIDNTLIAFATGDMLERQRQYGKAQTKFTEAGALLQQMIEADTNESGHMPKVIPSVEYEMTQDTLSGGGNWISRS